MCYEDSNIRRLGQESGVGFLKFRISTLFDLNQNQYFYALKKCDSPSFLDFLEPSRTFWDHLESSRTFQDTLELSEICQLS